MSWAQRAHSAGRGPSNERAADEQLRALLVSCGAALGCILGPVMIRGLYGVAAAMVLAFVAGVAALESP
jgi:hypothetical protein